MTMETQKLCKLLGKEGQAKSVITGSLFEGTVVKIHIDGYIWLEFSGDTLIRCDPESFKEKKQIDDNSHTFE